MRKENEVLLALLLVLLLINFVETMVTPAIPTIQSDFGTSEEVVSWVVSAFTISAAVGSPILGKVADIYGKKKTLVLVLVFYAIAVFIAGLAPNVYVLILARAIQGLGFAAFPISVAIITEMLPRERVAQAQGILSATFGIGTALGLSLGAILDQDLGWQMAFHVAFFGSIILIAVVSKVVPESKIKVKESLDLIGMALLASGSTLLLVYISEGNSWGWLSPNELLLLIAGSILLYSFVIWERIAREPMMKLELFKIRNFAVANIVGLITGVAMFLLFFGVIYYAQLPWPFGLGLDQISAGMSLAPGTLAMLFVGPLVGRALNRTGPKPILFVGGTFLIIGFFLNITNRATIFDITLNGIVVTTGMVLMMIPIVNMVAVSLPPEARGVGLGMNTLIRQMGSSIGPVLATSLMNAYESAFVMPLGSTYVVEVLPGSASFNAVFTAGILATLLALGFAAFTQNYKLEARPQVAAH